MKKTLPRLSHLLIVSLLLLIGKIAMAQSAYKLVKSNQTYIPLLNPDIISIDTSLSGNYIDKPSFSFNLFGRPYIFGAYNNGSDSSKGAFVTWYGSMILADTVNNNSAIIELIDENGNQLLYGETELSYELSGASGSRVLKVQWSNIGSDTSLNPASRLNCQLWFMEQSKEIVFHYGSCIAGNPSGFKPGLSITLLSNSAYEIPGAAIIAGSPSNDSLLSFRNITDINTYNNILSVSYFSGVPVNGTMYRFQETTTGINTLLHSPLTRIFPNPATNQLTVQSTISLSAEIYHINGQLVKNLTLQKGDNMIETDRLPGGVYYIKSKNQILGKFIKN